MPKTPKRRHLADAHAFPGFRPSAIVRGRFGDPQTRIVTLARRAKKPTAELAERCIAASTTVHVGRYEICRADRFVSCSTWKYAVFGADGVAQ
jgi:hypothetical protein